MMMMMVIIVTLYIWPFSSLQTVNWQVFHRDSLSSKDFAPLRNVVSLCLAWAADMENVPCPFLHKPPLYPTDYPKGKTMSIRLESAGFAGDVRR